MKARRMSATLAKPRLMPAALRLRAGYALFAAALGGFGMAAQAHDLTLDECIEGSDFIKHAAMSRDYGLSREAFLGRMASDIDAIQAFPPQLRWFVQDDDDKALLTEAAERVFDAPREPETHQSDFLLVCVERAGGGADADAGSTELEGAPPPLHRLKAVR
jgi:hypothetical protein